MSHYKPNYIEHTITTGNIHIAGDGKTPIPAYWAHPQSGSKFSAIVLVHDWWGITALERRLAHKFAQAGYYVIVPDLYDGAVAETHDEAMALVEKLSDGSGYYRVHQALHVLEHHNRCNGYTAAIGLGMGGTFAFEAAVTRTDIEAAIAYSGFPQRYMGRFKAAKTPTLAIYGTRDPYIDAALQSQLEAEFATATLPHKLIRLDGAMRNFFDDEMAFFVGKFGYQAWAHTLEFLERYLTPAASS